MMKRIFGGTETKLVQYVENTFHPEDTILTKLRERAEQKGLPSIQVGKMDGLHLEVLVRATGAKKAVEIGTLGGYSGICIARGMGPSGKLYTFEIDPVHAEFARESFREAHVSEQVEVFTGPALEKLNAITQNGPFDLVFIDADKVNYPFYLQWAAENLRIGGLVIGDNTFAWGMIADTEFDTLDDEQSAKGLQKFNQTLAQSGRFRSTILPTGEGMTLGVKIK
jgi:caffeoyl-CoA O-methyltransferase